MAHLEMPTSGRLLRPRTVDLGFGKMEKSKRHTGGCGKECTMVSAHFLASYLSPGVVLSHFLASYLSPIVLAHFLASYLSPVVLAPSPCRQHVLHLVWVSL